MSIRTGLDFESSVAKRLTYHGIGISRSTIEAIVSRVYDEVMDDLPMIIDIAIEEETGLDVIHDEEDMDV